MEQPLVQGFSFLYLERKRRTLETTLQLGHFRVLLSLFQNESKCETFHIKMRSACSFIFTQIKVIFMIVVSHVDSFWNREAQANKQSPQMFPPSCQRGANLMQTVCTCICCQQSCYKFGCIACFSLALAHGDPFPLRSLLFLPAYPPHSAKTFAWERALFSEML